MKCSYSRPICLLNEWYISHNTLGTVGNKTMIPPSNLLDFKRQGTWWKEEAHIKTSIDSFCIQHREGSPLYLSSQIWMETFCCSSHMCKKEEICRWRVMGELQFPRGKHDRLFPSLQRCTTDTSARAVYSEDCIGFSQMIQLDSLKHCEHTMWVLISFHFWASCKWNPELLQHVMSLHGRFPHVIEVAAQIQPPQRGCAWPINLN